MKNIYYIFLAIIILLSCKKKTEEVKPPYVFPTPQMKYAGYAGCGDSTAFGIAGISPNGGLELIQLRGSKEYFQIKSYSFNTISIDTLDTLKSHLKIVVYSKYFSPCNDAFDPAGEPTHETWTAKSGLIMLKDSIDINNYYFIHTKLKNVVFANGNKNIKLDSLNFVTAIYIW